MQRSILVCAAIMLCSLSSASSANEESSSCTLKLGSEPAMVAAKPEVAKAIFLAVENNSEKQPDRDGFPEVFVDDLGQSWSVWRGERPTIHHDRITVWRGGGQLALQIAKCDGRITSISYTR